MDLAPTKLAQKYIDEVIAELEGLQQSIKVVGFIATDDLPSMTYAKATQQKYMEVGIEYDLRKVKRLELESAILDANADTGVHGIFIYFPVFHNEQDVYLRNLVDYQKDIEAGSLYWTRKLYANDRLAVAGDQSRKALLPCTPLAIVKMLTEAGIYHSEVERPIEGKTVTIFNRSEVIGRPLAVMLSNDGARVYSFDINGPLVFENARPAEIAIDRATALAESDIVITGVPTASFPPISTEELKPGTVCVNFSSVANFDDDISDFSEVFIPRVGPMTVAMCMRNTLRLYRNFHLAENRD